MEHKVWFVTGCSRGFGRALAEAILERGDRLVASARSLESLTDLVTRWPAAVHPVVLDVTQEGQIRAAIEEGLRVFGRVDVLVNNAGYGLVGSLEASSPEQIERNFAVNCFGPLRIIQALLPTFRAQKSGHVVNFSAAAAISNYAGFGIYGAAKCALEGFSEALAQEGRPFGLKVTLVQPGPFRTDFISNSLEQVAGELPDYAQSAGKFAAFLKSMDGKQPGDAALAAQAILSAVDAPRPPLRLVLGRYAIEKTRRGWTQKEAELKAWESVGLSADAPPA